MTSLTFPSMLTLDAGWSDTKIIWRVTPFQPKLLMMSPEVAQVSKESIEFYKSRRVTVPSPENEAWVEYDGICYVVGFLAQKQFSSQISIEKPKYEWAIAKVLAAVGIMALKEGLTSRFDLALALPLPYSEWEDRTRFERDVKKALSDFSFCDKQLCVKLEVLLSTPEGGGHAMAVGSKLGALFNQRKIVSVMWGYRDISFVQFEKGVLSGQTQPMGFYKLIAMIQNRISGYNSPQRERLLLKTVHSVGKDIKSKNLKHLALSDSDARRAEEAEQITEVLQMCRSEYWEMIKQLIRSQIPFDADDIIVGGGAYDYYRSELRSFLGENFNAANIFWSADLEEDVRVAFDLSPKEKALSIRLTDAYALSNFLRSRICPTGAMKD